MSETVYVPVSIRTPVVIQREIDTLMAHIAAGVIEVRFADRTVKYDSLAAMWKVVGYLRAELAALLGIQPKTWIGFHRITIRRC